MDNNRPKHNPGFKGEKSVRDYDKRFENEDKQMTLELTKQDG